MRNLLYPLAASTLLGIVALACSPREKTPPSEPATEWLAFGKDILEAAQAPDKPRLIELSLSDVALGQEVMRAVTAANPDLEYSPPPEPPNAERIIRDYDEELEIFLRSYSDLFGNPLECVSAPPKDIKGVPFYSVILWVRDGTKLRGIKIGDVVRTSSGLRVNSWNGSVSPAQSGSLWKKRAVLEAAECEHPEVIEYKYEFVQ
jgi:hypothetical protein